MLLKVNLPEKDLHNLRCIAASNQITLTAALIQAIHNENFIGQQINPEDRLLIETKKGTRKQVLFS